jgi:hypothetical protein
MFAKKAEAAKKLKVENKLVARAWSKTAKSAIDLGYDHPVNRQAAKDLFPPRSPRPHKFKLG